MTDLRGFVPNDYPDGAERAPLPPGTYVGVIADSRSRTSANGNDYLELELEITDGPHAGRKIWDRINLWHPKSDVADIAKRRLAQACRALGIAAPKDSADLHDKPVGIIIAVKPRRDTGDKVNEVNGYATVSTPTKRVVTSGDVREGVSRALSGKKPKPEPVAASPDDDDIPF